MLPPLLSVLPTLLSPGHIVGDGVDAFGTGWFFWWIRACVTHLGNPSWTPLFFAPDGKDIFSHTGNNFVDAVFSVPFQVLFGGSWSAPFTLFLLAGNAWSFEHLAKELWPDTRDVVAATLAWMVNPYVIFELTAGRPTQACMWWLPLALVGLWRVCRGDGARAAVLLGVSTALTGWTYWFAGYFLAFLMLPLCLWWGGFRRLPALALAAAVCTVLVLPMGVGMQASWVAGQVPGVASGGPRQANVSEDLHGIWLMETQGAPLLTQPAWALAALFGLWKGGSAGRKWAAIALLLVLIGLGARVSDHKLLNPVWAAVSHLPFLSRLWFPYRLTMVILIPFTALAVLAWQATGRSVRAAAAFLVVSLAGEAYAGVFPLNHHAASCPPLLIDAAREPGTFLFLPSGIQSDALLWQTQFQRPTFGGMGESARAFWPEAYRDRLRTPWFRALASAVNSGPPSSPSSGPTSVEKITPEPAENPFDETGLRWVVLRRDLLLGIWHKEQDEGSKTTIQERDTYTVDQLIALLGEPAAADDTLILWDLKGRYANPNFTLTPERRRTPPPDTERRSAVELGLIRLGRAHQSQ
jgi:hypothetical protein